jgi:hypothetical protein
MTCDAVTRIQLRTVFDVGLIVLTRMILGHDWARDETEAGKCGE